MLESNLSPQLRYFFKGIEQYINCKLYFYGSVCRKDYFQHKSDIDVDIFSDNIGKTLLELQTYLDCKDCKNPKTIVTIINRVTIQGKKLIYNNPNLNITCEFSIFHNKDKSLILHEHHKKTDLPIYCIWLLFIVKTLYYSYNLIEFKTYKVWKKHILSYCIGYTDPPYLII